ncbi:Growth arrest-specific protein 8 [Tetrabaena socialis]|uniref:Growth arrest-specific protein 8 n=1 Tax=Tetrabaena socialis TaxID=47790 RepID=A0A2J8ADC0_9CHLO|nr:Growth arrest-specific protein 8 [Tetrabaena socialis]|eukprot:PNH10507.1 Growth arrest-specific protein 8 [Tetrabaena socialis]
MAPKKKTVKKESKKDALQTGDIEGASVEELNQKIGTLEKEKNKEEEYRNYMQLERDKINAFWEITKKDLEDRRAELRNKDREMEEMEERHQVEIKELAHQDIIRQLKLEHAKEITKLRQEFELQAKELQQKYEKKMKMLRDDMELRRKQIIKALQYDVAKVSKAHNDLIRVYEAKLTEFGIPVDELGFRPLVTNTSTGPAGLVVGA